MTRYNKITFFIILFLVVVLVGKLWSDKKNGVALSGEPYQALLAENVSANTSGGMPVISKVVSTSDLYFGLKNNEAVKNLQQFLKDTNFYTGPITGNFFSLTLAAVKKFQIANSITPVAGFVGPKTRKVINGYISKKVEEPLAVSPKVIELPEDKPIITTPIIPAEIPKPVEALKSNLKLVTTYPALSLGKYSDVILHEFRLDQDASDGKVALTKIKFKNTGTLSFGYIVDLKLINSNSGKVLATAQEKNDGTIEFVLTPDASLTDKGLMVSGGLYGVVANLIVPNAGVRPYIKLTVLNASDITAVDFNDLTRSVTLNSSWFPFDGPQITLP